MARDEIDEPTVPSAEDEEVVDVKEDSEEVLEMGDTSASAAS